MWYYVPVMRKYIPYVLFVVLTAIIMGSGFYLFRDKKDKPKDFSVKQTTTFEKKCSFTDEEIINSVNKLRRENNVRPVVFSHKLDNFSNRRAEEQNGSLDNHEGLVGSAQELNFYQVGEIQRGYFCETSDRVVYAFRVSKAHWDSLLSSKWEYIGVGLYKNMVVINFGYGTAPQQTVNVQRPAIIEKVQTVDYCYNVYDSFGLPHKQCVYK